MLSNILIALGFLGTGILVGLTLAAYAIKSDSKKSEKKKIGNYTVIFEYDN